MKLIILILALFQFFSPVSTQEKLERYESFKIERYNIKLEINDSTDFIKGKTGILISLINPVEEVIMDLASTDAGDTGMTVDSILKNGILVDHIHRENKLHISVFETDTGIIKYDVYYQGQAGEGIIISENMHGEKTFFADNWPNNAHNWFPCIDHPSERALVDFAITAPSHYQVIATGLLTKKVTLPGKRITHYWSSSVPVPVKVMAFAAAGFAVQYHNDIDGIPYSNWVYPQNIEEGFHDFAITPDIIRFFTDLIGPYPFEKIANVQSTTRYGGMEKAGNIFYHERSVKGDRSIEPTMVHEMAHQWFGNSVSEADWPHLWLSEGIATWLTDIYIEQHYGTDKLKEKLITYRNNVIDYSRVHLAPIVDYHANEPADLLNPNTYQKASWILHMLGEKIGRSTLIKGIVEYYDQFKHNSASSYDFVEVIENVSGVDLNEFADDWLYSAGHPVISLSTSYSNGTFLMELTQVQQHKMAFTFPVEIKLILEDESEVSFAFDILFRRHEFVLKLPSEPVEVIIDPDIKLLFEQV